MRLPWIMVQSDMEKSAASAATAVPTASLPSTSSSTCTTLHEEENQATASTSSGALPIQRKMAVCGTAPMLTLHNGRRTSNVESMSFSSQDSDLDDVVRVKRMSSETGSMSSDAGPEVIALSSYDSCSGDSSLDELDDLLLSMQGQIVECRARSDDIKAFENSYRETKGIVREMAQELVMKIREHEARLLEEIEARRENMYKRLGYGRDKVDKQIKIMQKLFEEGEAVGAEAARVGQPQELSTEYPEMVEKLRQGLESKELQPLNMDVKVLPICLSSVRCNTAFAYLDASEKNDSSYSMNGVRRRSIVPLAHSPTKPSRLRTGSLQVSSSVGFNMQHLGVGDSTGPCRRYSLQHGRHHHQTINLSPNLQHGWRSRHGACTLTESYEDSLTPSTATQLLWEITTEGPLQGQINCPNDITFLPNGHLVVSDRDNHRLQVFDTEGKVLSIIGEGKIHPRRMCTTKDGNIAVTDSKDSMIKVFDPQGNLVSSFGKKRFKQLFKSPCGIACNSRGQFIVSDMERHTVTIHSAEGKLIRHLGGSSGGVMEFHSPSYVTVNKRNQIIVADNWNHCVQVFDEQGNFLLQASADENELKYPNGIACDTKGQMFVAEWGSHTVAQFGDDGKFRGHVLNRYENNIYHPAGIAIHGSRLAVSEYSDTHSAIRLYAMDQSNPL